MFPHLSGKRMVASEARSRSAAVFGAPFDLYRSGHAQYWTKLVSCLDFDRSCASTANDGFS
jgi:hypothetical protein